MGRIAQHYVELSVKDAKFQQGMRKAEGGLDKFSGALKQLGGVLAAAFTTERIVQYGTEAVRLAAKAEGISAAFEKLNRVGLLDDLRKGVNGTIDDLTLMRSAVRAENFKIPLEKLATFFKFATDRATQTGESVDYLVNSIIDGIGRKSTLVMDNLGISAAELQQEIKKTGDFGLAAGNIIEREMAKAGDVADTTKTRFDRLNTTFANMQVQVGQKLLPTVNKFLDIIQELVENSGKLSANLSVFNDLGNVFKELQQTFSKISGSDALSFFDALTKYMNYLLWPLRYVLKALRGIVDQVNKGINLVKGAPSSANFGGPQGANAPTTLDQQLAGLNNQFFPKRTGGQTASPEKQIGRVATKLEEIKSLANHPIFQNGLMTSMLYGEDPGKGMEMAAQGEENLSRMFENISGNLSAVSGFLTGFFEGFASAFTSGQNVLQQFADYFKKWALQIITQIAAIAAAAAVLSIFTGGSFGGLFSGLFGGSGLGKVFGGFKGLSEVGRGQGALQGVLKGEDIFVAYNRYAANKGGSF